MHVFPILVVMLIYISSRLREIYFELLPLASTLVPCKLPSCELHSYLYLASCTHSPYKLSFCELSSCKLLSSKLLSCKLLSCKLSSCELSSCKLSSYKLCFHFSVLGYGLITSGVEVDLRRFSSTRTHFDKLSFEEVS